MHVESDTIHSRVDKLTDGLNVLLTELAKIVLVEDNQRSAIVRLLVLCFSYDTEHKEHKEHRIWDKDDVNHAHSVVIDNNNKKKKKKRNTKEVTGQL